MSLKISAVIVSRMNQFNPEKYNATHFCSYRKSSTSAQAAYFIYTGPSP